MRHPAKFRPVRLLGQTAAVAILAGSAAGCSSDVSRFGDMFGPTDNQNQIITGSVAPAQASAPAPLPAYQSPAVASQPLPAPPGAVASSAPYVRPTGQPLAPPPAAAPVPVAAAPAAGVPGWSAAGGTTVTVAPGDSVAVLSRRYGVPEQALLAANGLSKGAPLAPGQSVVIPAYSYGTKSASAAPAPSPSPVPAAPAATRAASVYVVKPGDSLGRIANDHGMRSSELAAANGIDGTQPIRIGQKLKIPAAGVANTKVAMLDTGTATDAAPLGVIPKPAMAPAKPAQALSAAPAPLKPAAPAPTEPAAPAPVKQAALAPQATQPVRPAPTVTAPSSGASGAGAAQAAAADDAATGSFRWPVRGRVISGYGVKASGERNDGINIEAPEGTPIKAAEGGEVIYAGNELKGYGNLVLIKHPSGFVSAYAHAGEILVQRGDTIMRGQTVGKVGATGNVTRPQLHFELRSGNRPVDPLPYLRG